MFSIQTPLENERALLVPLVEADFDDLYTIASDKKVWEQHPNKDRWQETIFRTFFEGAMQSKGAFKIIDKETDLVAGSTRFYSYNEEDNSIQIGYTFLATQFWGTGLNPAVKKLMLAYAFQFVNRVYFQVGAGNLRSQIAVSRLGATKIAEQEVAYFGEQPKLNFVYELKKQ
ncbi:MULTISPECIES: GNAT family N-acetyltransferase [Olivibacter]|jgi:RimJ/RimL family protein N-acetyltransferase|uniref:GNAT family N-acetyltransferase n=2 Tax=Olivibacter TaxID=376469 RepID=A0ABV6HES4_9SPHI|nr:MULTISPECIES: GNAT family N-acetyltransferase [Olivibacter]MCL4640924.1 GNAT family N-acetyltransferase [Olivibacter sp. UJ_SKK_5.1]MDM8177945.1 GNAT family N-acetyltransferase [Olivibacter sp. 47]QEK99628.1 GNAT family N-acetyltransferase [Olivibacter sp. LS-1]